jgi:hypothetical protein
MFDFFRRPDPRPLSDTIRRAIQSESVTGPHGDPSTLRMVELSGRYAGRKVTFFRIFDSTTAAQRSLNIRRYKEFDVFPGLVLRSGHLESDGTVVLARPAVDQAARTPARSAADRTMHLDDAHIVVHGETGATANPRTGKAPEFGQTTGSTT